MKSKNTAPAIVPTTIPNTRLGQRQVKVRIRGKLLEGYSPTEAARIIGVSSALVTRFMNRGDVRVIVSAGGRARWLLKEDVDAIAADRGKVVAQAVTIIEA